MPLEQENPYRDSSEYSEGLFLHKRTLRDCSESLLEPEGTQKELGAQKESGPSLEIGSWPRMFFPKLLKSLLTLRRGPEDGRERSVEWIGNRIDGRFKKLFWKVI
jgi:hypothetical protein